MVSLGFDFDEIEIDEIREGRLDFLSEVGIVREVDEFFPDYIEEERLWVGSGAVRHRVGFVGDGKNKVIKNCKEVSHDLGFLNSTYIVFNEEIVPQRYVKNSNDRYEQKDLKVKLDRIVNNRMAVKFKLKSGSFDRFDSLRRESVLRDIIRIVEKEDKYDRVVTKKCDLCKNNTKHYAFDNYVVKDSDYLERVKKSEKSHTDYACKKCGKGIVHSDYNEKVGPYYAN